jgi:hygromycin-B 4-O-kinase
MSIIDAVSVKIFLRSYFDLRISNVEKIGAGMFSQAFSFNLEQEKLMIRLNPYVEDFQKDAFAYQHFSSKLPIPKMIKCDRVAYPKGNHFKQNYYFAITERCEGNTLNTLEVIPDIVLNLFEILYELQSFDTSQYSGWGLTNASGNGLFASWEEYLLSFYNQKFAFTWKQLFDSTCMEQKVYKIYFSTLKEYLPFCLTNKYWVHGDFGFDNVMSCGKKITGVLDWAESRLGDFVYDLAYLEFWSDNVPYKRLWQNWAESKNLSIDNFEQRMNCYMIHIGLASLAIAAIQDDLEDYTQVKGRMKTVIATSY